MADSDAERLRIFAPKASAAFGAAVALSMGRPLDPMEEREFEDHEHKARPLVGVRGCDAYVIQGLHDDPGQSPNDKLVRLLFFLGCLRSNGAARTTAVIPYLAYARKDRQTKPRDPLSLSYVARLIEAMGTGRVLTFEPHNLAAVQNAFRIEVVALDLRGVMIARAAALAGGDPVTVASPDPGGVKRAQLFREALEARIGRSVAFAFLEKRRSAGVVSGSLLAGDVHGRRVLVVDDLIAGGGTMRRAAAALKAAGAASVHALAAHGLFTSGAEALSDPAVDGWHVTDSIPSRGAEPGNRSKIDSVSAAPLFAEAIRRLHLDGQVSDLISGLWR
ncbi:ribose-phosphate diphosphokinase [Palleronia sp. KMU-117]|uniref:ribose-phosphate diphosphokinase n=1 Tax=Palleronia sp. KMU-117 TaxID=3434108 RepID=UPI003D721A9A